MSRNRKEVRQALGVLLTAALPDDVTIYTYQALDFDQATPVVAITSAGTARERITMRGSTARFTIDVHTFVLLTDQQADYSPADAEDRLDDIEAAICQTVDGSQRHAGGLWTAIKYAEPTNARDTVTLGGVTYLHEVIPLELTTT